MTENHRPRRVASVRRVDASRALALPAAGDMISVDRNLIHAIKAML